MRLLWKRDDDSDGDALFFAVRSAAKPATSSAAKPATEIAQSITSYYHRIASLCLAKTDCVVVETTDVGLHPLTGADPKRVNRDGANCTPNGLLGQGSQCEDGLHPLTDADSRRVNLLDRAHAKQHTKLGMPR